MMKSNYFEKPIRGDAVTEEDALSNVAAYGDSDLSRSSGMKAIDS